MGGEIVKQYAINEENLDKSHYMESLLQEAMRLNLFSEKELEKIQLKLVGFLSKQVERYTHGESSSVRVETANLIMQSVYYSIGTYLKSLANTDEALKILKESELPELFSKGQDLIKTQFAKTKLLFAMMRKKIIKTENIAYNGTINTVIPGFFVMYDMEFGAHRTNSLLDYPLCIDKMDTAGIEYINGYVKKLSIENDFCSLFSNESIEALLNDYHKDYRELLLNIFQLVLTNSLASILIKKSAAQLNITPEECEKLRQKLSAMNNDEYHNAISEAKIRLLDELKISDIHLQDYISEALCEIEIKITNALKISQLPSVIIINKKKDDSVIKFEDNNKMDDEFFRSVIDLISDCENTNDKLEIIKREVHSFEDLYDILCADCIYSDEFHDVFSSLEDLEIALLFKKISPDCLAGENNVNDNYISSAEKELHIGFTTYLKALDEIKRQSIIALAEKINF